MGLDLMVREFEGFEVRTQITEDGDVWFIAKDVMMVLGIKHQHNALKKLRESQRGMTKLSTLGGFQEFQTVNRSGLYALIFQSRKPNAVRFQDWVTDVVLPSIEKTGSYSVVKELDPLDQLRMHLTIMEKQRDEIIKINQSLTVVAEEAKQINDSLTYDQATQLDAEMEKKYREIGIKNFKILGYMKKQVKSHFFDNPKSFTFKEIPRSGFETAIEIVRSFKAPSHLMRHDPNNLN